jgi:hypothetical protein
LRGRLRNLEREAAVSLVLEEHEDGTTFRFCQEEISSDCFLY